MGIEQRHRTCNKGGDENREHGVSTDLNPSLVFFSKGLYIRNLRS
jgi:hypothetical protein